MKQDKEYEYIGDLSLAVSDIYHERRFYLKKGDIIVESQYGNYSLTNGTEVLVTSKLLKLLRPHLSVEQKEYYTHLRDTAAVNAMQAMLSCSDWKEQIEKEAESSVRKDNGENSATILADYALLYANTLTKRLVKEGTFAPDTIKK